MTQPHTETSGNTPALANSAFVELRQLRDALSNYLDQPINLLTSRAELERARDQFDRAFHKFRDAVNQAASQRRGVARSKRLKAHANVIAIRQLPSVEFLQELGAEFSKVQSDAAAQLTACNIARTSGLLPGRLRLVRDTKRTRLDFACIDDISEE